jgi:hypothetical protein
MAANVDLKILMALPHCASPCRKMTAAEYIAARRIGQVTCVEYTTALVKRMIYYRYMAQFMYWDNFPQQVRHLFLSP